MSQNDLIRIYNTPKGSHVYFEDVRVHHWTGGLIATIIGTLGLFFDEDKDRRPFYMALLVGGVVAFLDDLPDFMLFLETLQE